MARARRSPVRILGAAPLPLTLSSFVRPRKKPLPLPRSFFGSTFTNYFLLVNPAQSCSELLGVRQEGRSPLLPTSHWVGARGFQAVTSHPKLPGTYPPRGARQEVPEGPSWQWTS
eukprot:14715676-Heterocapsa_arctica.AAC.1